MMSCLIGRDGGGGLFWSKQIWSLGQNLSLVSRRNFTKSKCFWPSCSSLSSAGQTAAESRSDFWVCIDFADRPFHSVAFICERSQTGPVKELKRNWLCLSFRPLPVTCFQTPHPSNSALLSQIQTKQICLRVSSRLWSLSIIFLSTPSPARVGTPSPRVPSKRPPGAVLRVINK